MGWRGKGFGTKVGVKRCSSRDTWDHASQPQEQLRVNGGVIA